MRTLTTIEDVLAELGGTKAVGELTKRTSPSAVTNWILRKEFPTNTYAIMRAALAAKGATAPGHLWGMPELVSEHDGR